MSLTRFQETCLISEHGMQFWRVYSRSFSSILIYTYIEFYKKKFYAIYQTRSIKFNGKLPLESTFLLFIMNEKFKILLTVLTLVVNSYL